MDRSRYVTRRQAFGAAGLGVTALALPAAIAAASGAGPGAEGGGGGFVPVAYDPVVQFRNDGTLGSETLRVISAWAEGYTFATFGPANLDGTTGAEMPFSWTLEGTARDDTPLSLSGTHSTGVLTLSGNSAKVGTVFTFTLNSTGTPSGDMRFYTWTR